MTGKSNVRKLCILGMLCALTIVLGFYATWRPTPSIKISLKFCPVFVAGYLFGPVVGGLVGIASDIASYIANPGGALLPLITIAEFLYGFMYGLFFYRKNSRIIAPVLCVLIQATVLDGLLKTYALMFDVAFASVLVTRIFGICINFSLQLALIILLNSYLPKLKQQLNIF